LLESAINNIVTPAAVFLNLWHMLCLNNTNFLPTLQPSRCPDNMSKSMKPLFSFFLLLIFSLPVSAEGGFNLLDSLGGSQDDILDPDDAFQISYDSQPGKFKVSWVIADGHYLYRDKVKITTDETAINSKPLVMPAGDAKDDPYSTRRSTYSITLLMPHCHIHTPVMVAKKSLSRLSIRAVLKSREFATRHRPKNSLSIYPPYRLRRQQPSTNLQRQLQNPFPNRIRSPMRCAAATHY